MKSSITLQLDYDSDKNRWDVGCISRTDGDLDLCCTEACGPFAGWADVAAWSMRMLAVWAAPPLHSTPSESLHDAWAQHP